MQNVTLIVAADPNNVIGREGKLPWRIPEDLQLFRKRTLGHVIMMGRKTWISLPKKPLDGRANVVISSSYYEHPSASGIGPYFHPTPEYSLRTIRDSWKYCHLADYSYKDIFVIGGAQLYKYFIENNLANRIIMSKIHEQYEGDVYFPKLDDTWEMSEVEKHQGFDTIYWLKKTSQ